MCLARYKAENIDRAPRGPGGEPAMLGTSVHGGLEAYVQVVYIDKKAPPSFELLDMLWRKSYMDTFGTSDLDSEWFRDGAEMIHNWFLRTPEHFENATVISAEVKETFEVMVPDSTGIGSVTVPFNYIWDRVDEMPNGVIRVIDYKTQRWAWSPVQLRKKPQCRLYGLAAQIKWPSAQEIWVEFDFLRHDPSIAGVRFTKDDNKQTWLDLKKILKRIVDVPDDTPYEDLETINDECRYCVRKATCSTLARNVAVGGTLGLPLPELIDRRAQADMQIKALKMLVDEADRLIETSARNMDQANLSTDHTELSFGRRTFRTVDADRAKKILGDELWAAYGKETMLMGDVDDLLKKKNPTLSADQKRDLKSIIAQNQGEPYVVTKPL